MSSAIKLSLLTNLQDKVKTKQYNDFVGTLPKDIDLPKNYNLRDYWEDNNMPANFDTASNVGMFTKKEDGGFETPITSVKSGKFLIPFDPNNKMFMDEVNAYQTNDDIRKKFRLDTSSKYWQYKERGQGETPIRNSEGLVVGYRDAQGKVTMDSKVPVIDDTKGEFIGFYDTQSRNFEPFGSVSNPKKQNIIRVNDSGAKLEFQDTTENDFVSNESLQEVKNNWNKKITRTLSKEEMNKAIAEKKPMKIVNKTI